MAETTVIHVRDLRRDNPLDEYIGRANRHYKLKASPWANPFPIRGGYEREQALADFEHWVRMSDDPKAVWIREHILWLEGLRLACYCAPDHRCHGHILIKLLDERLAQLHADDSDASHADPLGEVA